MIKRLKMTTPTVRTRNTNIIYSYSKQSFTLNLISTQKQDKFTGTLFKRLSFTACFPVYVEDTLTARTSVISILEKVEEEWNQAASQKQSVKQKTSSLSWFKTEKAFRWDSTYPQNTKTKHMSQAKSPTLYVTRLVTWAWQEGQVVRAGDRRSLAS